MLLNLKNEKTIIEVFFMLLNNSSHSDVFTKAILFHYSWSNRYSAAMVL